MRSEITLSHRNTGFIAKATKSRQENGCHVVTCYLGGIVEKAVYNLGEDEADRLMASFINHAKRAYVNF